MICRELFFRAIDPVHIGTGGYNLGRVDNSVVREPATNIPKIPGTALSGASRHYAAAAYSKASDVGLMCAGLGQDSAQHCGECPICYTFGYSRADADNYAGTVNVFDAQILLFPTRSIYGMVWVTTERLLIDGKMEIPSEMTIPYTANEEWKNKLITLGWQLIDSLEYGELALGNVIDNIVNSRVVIVDEASFGFIVNGNMEVRTSVAIDPETGTAKDKALFTYEAIPRNTIFMMEVIEDDYRTDRDKYFPPNDNDLNWSGPMDVLCYGLHEISCRGIGGMGTRGFGRIVLLENESDSTTPPADGERGEASNE